MKAALLKLLTNPWYGGIAGLCSIIAVPLSFYLFWAALPTRSLSYSESPSRAVIAEKERPESLEVRHRGKLIADDVSAAQLQAWNSGNSSIRPENVLKPFRISLGEGASVIEVTVIRETRPEIGARASRPSGDERGVDLSWAILEPEDGVLIQVIYAGPKDTPIRLDGVVEGQKRGARRIDRPKDPKPVWMLACLLIFSAAPIYQICRLVPKVIKSSRPKIAKILFFAVLPVAAVTLGYVIFDVGAKFLKSFDPSPPSALVVEPRP